ncbi:hypothetical protein TSAR_010220 [Trichomalopsis sarcophagae]|uniref:Uncharacterized protein n=1 Tax=Trichomalopsis sarcophagae TaxID=543379 RepID=A0A232FMP3_9HYME|nr:hypothetical protein TSAR_010220 [Trichomalopsis sarcophagae]
MMYKKVEDVVAVVMMILDLCMEDIDNLPQEVHLDHILIHINCMKKKDYMRLQILIEILIQGVKRQIVKASS